MNIKLMTDSASDLPEDLIEKYDIDVLPLYVLDGDKEYLDRIEISPEKVLEDMKTGTVYKTAQVSLEAFLNKFREYLEKDQIIIYISFSSELSGTFSNAYIAKESLKTEYPNGDIVVIDSKAASGGLGFIVLEIAKMIEKGSTKDEVLERLEKLMESIEHIFTIDDIEYLYRGGRVSKAQNIIGGLLSIKPILWVDKGRLEPLEKVRGKNKVLKSMLDIIERLKGETDLKEQTIIITHGNDLEAANKLKEMMMERFGVEKFIINTIGSVIGAHAGPGTLAVFFLKENV